MRSVIAFTNCLLVDDHAMFRAGLGLLLREAWPGLRLLEAGSLEVALRLPETQAQAPDLLLLDIKLQGLNGLECIALFKRHWPAMPIIMLSADEDPAMAQTALARGAAAFVSKTSSAEAIVATIQQVLANDGLAPDENTMGGAGAKPLLSPRQLSVLNLLSQGQPNKVIGHQLAISENTVRGHVQALLQLLQAHSRQQAVHQARRLGLLS